MNENSRVTGRILNIQHFCVDDGPGIRSVIFLKGCPLRCAWCHNPESQSHRKELLYRLERCAGCGACSTVCKAACHRIENGAHLFDRSECKNCGSCAEACAFSALQLAGVDISVDEVMVELLPEKVFYEQSHGGVTVSGGEPLSQSEFTLALLETCKDEGLHTCIETCGFGKSGDILRIAAVTDLFLFDYKLTDSVLHEKYTGVSNRVILENLDLLCLSGAKIILRCPMIPDVNMTTEHYDGICELARKYKNIKEIHLEPYHPLGVGKSTALGRIAPYDRTEFLDKKELSEVRDLIAHKVDVNVKIS